MSSFQTHFNAARRKLLYPTRASCDDETILAPLCIEVIDELVIKQQNTLEPSLIAFATLNVVVGQSTYTVDNIAPNYGKARYLYSKNVSNNSDFQRQRVELVSLEILTEQYRGGDNLGAFPITSNLPLVSQAATVYYDINRGNVLEVAPIPQQAVTYDLLYEPSTLRPTTKQSQGFTLEQFDALVAAKLAFKALLHCQWKGLSRAEAREQRKEIRESLMYEIGSPDSRSGLEYLFWQYNLTTFQKTDDTMIGFLQGKLY